MRWLGRGILRRSSTNSFTDYVTKYASPEHVDDKDGDSDGDDASSMDSLSDEHTPDLDL